MRDLKLPNFLQDWLKTGGQINCPAPLPEDPEDARLTGLLGPAPHVVPEKKAKKEAKETRSSSPRQVLSVSEAESPPEDEEEEEEAPPPVREEKKRKVAPTGETGGSKKGRILPPDFSTIVDNNEEDWPTRAKPLARS